MTPVFSKSLPSFESFPLKVHVKDGASTPSMMKYPFLPDFEASYTRLVLASSGLRPMVKVKPSEKFAAIVSSKDIAVTALFTFAVTVTLQFCLGMI